MSQAAVDFMGCGVSRQTEPLPSKAPLSAFEAKPHGMAARFTTATQMLRNNIGARVRRRQSPVNKFSLPDAKPEKPQSPQHLPRNIESEPPSVMAVLGSPNRLTVGFSPDGSASPNCPDSRCSMENLTLDGTSVCSDLTTDIGSTLEVKACVEGRLSALDGRIILHQPAGHEDQKTKLCSDEQLLNDRALSSSEDNSVTNIGTSQDFPPSSDYSADDSRGSMEAMGSKTLVRFDTSDRSATLPASTSAKTAVKVKTHLRHFSLGKWTPGSSKVNQVSSSSSDSNMSEIATRQSLGKAFSVRKGFFKFSPTNRQLLRSRTVDSEIQTKARIVESPSPEHDRRHRSTTFGSGAETLPAAKTVPKSRSNLAKLLNSYPNRRKKGKTVENVENMTEVGIKTASILSGDDLDDIDDSGLSSDPNLNAADVQTVHSNFYNDFDDLFAELA